VGSIGGALTHTARPGASVDYRVPVPVPAPATDEVDDEVEPLFKHQQTYATLPR